MAKGNSQYVFLSIILIDAIFRTGNNYYLQVFLEEFRYIVKEKKMPEVITDDIEIFSDNFDREDSNEENFDEENYSERN